MLQGQKDLITVGRLILSELAPVVAAQHAVFYILDSSRDTPQADAAGELRLQGPERARQPARARRRAGRPVRAREAEDPADQRAARLHPRSPRAWASAPPQNIIVLPVMFEGQVKGVLELASFERFNPTHQAFLDQLTETIGIVLNTIEANMRTEDLLKQSQSLAAGAAEPAGGAAADQRGAAGEGRPAGRTRTRRSSARTRRSSRRGRRWKRRPSSSR